MEQIAEFALMRLHGREIDQGRDLLSKIGLARTHQLIPWLHVRLSSMEYRFGKPMKEANTNSLCGGFLSRRRPEILTADNNTSTQLAVSNCLLLVRKESGSSYLRTLSFDTLQVYMGKDA